MTAATLHRSAVPRGNPGWVTAAAETVLAGCDGVLRGVLSAAILTVPAMIGAVLALSPWAAATGLRPDLHAAPADGLMLLPVAGPIAWTVARRSTAALAQQGLIDVRSSKLVVGGIGGMGLLLGFLFVFRVGGWPVAGIMEALVIAAWIAGAVAVGRIGVVRPTARRVLPVWALVGIGLFIAMGPVGGLADTDASWDPFSDRDVTAVGVPIPDDVNGPYFSTSDEGSGLIRYWFAGGASVEGWTEPRFEIWAAIAHDGVFGDDRAGNPDPAVAGPVKVVAVDPGGPMPIIVRYDDIRGLREAIVVFTVVRGGTRYVVDDAGVVASYRSTLFDFIRSFGPGSSLAVQPVAR
jgi:hypothetical protein